MKKIFFISSLFSVVILTGAGCKKSNDFKATYTNTPAEKALLKINYLSGYTSNPGVLLSINNTIVSNLITSRTPFPGGGFNTNGQNFPDYLIVNPGTVELTGAIPKKGTGIDSIRLFGTNLTLQAGKNYTAHVTDTSIKTKVVLTEDDLTKPAPGFARFKFLNMMPNVAAVDLYYGNTLVAGNIPYLGVSNYFTVAVPATALAWNVRETGTGPSGTVLATYTSANTTLDQRVYTAFALGYKGSTDAVRKPYISFLLNN